MIDLELVRLQVLALKEAKGWTDTDPKARALHLCSEVGEVAKAVINYESNPSTENLQQLEDEMYDVLWNLVDLALLSDARLDAAAERKSAFNMHRHWP